MRRLRLVLLSGVLLAPVAAQTTPARLAAFGTGRPGSAILLRLHAPAQKGLPYQLISAFGSGPVRIQGYTLYLTPDNLFWLTVQNLVPQVFAGYRGFLDAQGRAAARIQVPRIPVLLGLELFTAFVTYRVTPPQGIVSVSNTVETVLGKCRYWQAPPYDPAGTRRYPYRSIVPRRGVLTTLNTIPLAGIPTVLTTDLTGDGVADAVLHLGGAHRLQAYTFPPAGPVALWTHAPANAQASRCTYLGDVDRDGQHEVLVSYRDTAKNLKIDVLDLAGQLQKTINLGTWSGSTRDYALAVLAAGGDYLVCSFTAGYNRQPRGPGLVQYSTGKLVAFFQTGGGGLGAGPTAVGDADWDGRPDVALSWATWHNGATGNGTTDGDCFGVVVEANLLATPPTLAAVFIRNVKTWNRAANPDGVFVAMMPDRNRDGADEILFFHGHDQRYYRGRDYVYAPQYPTGGLTTLVDTGWRDGGFYLRAAVVRDLTGDGVDELVVSPWTAAKFGRLLVLDGASLKILKTVTHPGRVVAALADVTGDGADELLTYDPAGGLYLLSTRTFQPLGPAVSVGPVAVTGIAVSDVTGDGTPEVLLGEKVGQGGRLLVLEIR